MSSFNYAIHYFPPFFRSCFVCQFNILIEFFPPFLFILPQKQRQSQGKYCAGNKSQTFQLQIHFCSCATKYTKKGADTRQNEIELNENHSPEQISFDLLKLFRLQLDESFLLFFHLYPRASIIVNRNLFHLFLIFFCWQQGENGFVQG
jgi:hypothetical protein